MFGDPVYEKSMNADRKNPCISTWRYDSLGRMIYAVCDGLLKRILEKRMLKHINNMRKKIGVKDAKEKMSEIKEFDLLKYLKDDGIYLENVSLQNCRLTSSGAYSLFFRKCIFQNVILDGEHEEWGDALFYECEFRNCMFRGDFGETYLDWRENFFKTCLFENINIEYGGDISSITENGFFDCCFKNVKLNQDIHFINVMISNGSMQNIHLFSTHMIANLFSNIQMEQVKISALYSSNIMDSIIFKDVILKWELEDDNYPDENIFYHCDTSGLTCYEHVGEKRY